MLVGIVWCCIRTWLYYYDMSFSGSGLRENGGLFMASGKDLGRWKSESECWILWQFLIHPFS